MPVNHWIHNDLKKDAQARLLSSNSFLAQLFTHKQIENLFKPGLSFMKIPQNALLWRAYLFEIYRQEVTSTYWLYFIFKTYSTTSTVPLNNKTHHYVLAMLLLSDHF